jgi:glutamate 5-kinase
VADPAALGRCRSGTDARRWGSGGMRSKVVAAEMATAAGIPTVIAAG